MAYKFSPDQRVEALRQLRVLLEGQRVQDLRDMARRWNWPLKGVAKAELVEQVLAYVADAGRMAACYAALPAAEQEALPWLTTLQGQRLEHPLQAVLQLSAGRKLSDGATDELLTDLLSRGMLFYSNDTGYSVPLLYNEWLPELVAPALAYAGRLQEVPLGSVEDLGREVDNLLDGIEMDRPTALPPATPEPIARGVIVREGKPIEPRPGLLPAEVLARWGYGGGEDYDRGRFLLELLVSGGLLRVDQRDRHLWPVPASMASWQDLPPSQRRTHLASWWGLNYQKLSSGGTQPLGFHELDMALRAAGTYQLYSTSPWDERRLSLEIAAAMTRAWLLALLNLLQRDTWYDFARFCETVFSMQRDLFRSSAYGIGWQWYREKQRIDPYQVNLETWMATYGTLVQAWFAGPARWLGLVQVATDSGRLVAFQRPSGLVARESATVPAGALTFDPAGGAFRLQNLWQAGELRALLRRVAIETQRDREATAYRLDAATFRATLRAGGTAQGLIDAFAAAGFPLSGEFAGRLERWQATFGRHHIYDNLAVVEFADDLAIEELRATTALGHTPAYIATARCLVILDPDSVPELIDELRRKGYTPQVLAAPAGKEAG